MSILDKFWEIGEDYYNEHYIPLQAYTREECIEQAAKQLDVIYEALVSFSVGKNLTIRRGQDYVKKLTENISVCIEGKNNTILNRYLANEYLISIYYSYNYAPKIYVTDDLKYIFDIHIESLYSYTSLNNKNKRQKPRKFTERRLYEILKHFQPLWEIK